MNLHTLASKGDVEAVRHQLARGVPVDLRDENDFTALACASSSPDANSVMLSVLIDAGSDVNASVDSGNTHPVSIAACTGDLEKVQTLVSAGANVNEKSVSGYTALINVMYKLFDSDQLLPMVKRLVEFGAETDVVTRYGESPLSVSSHFGRFDVVRFLLDSGADSSTIQWNELMKAVAFGTTEEVKRQLDAGIHLSSRDRWERTPWLLAAVVGSIPKAKLILAAGADTNVKERGGSTALAICADRGNPEMLAWLLKSGLDIEAVDDADNTSLMLAAQAGEVECVRLLIEAGADTSRVNDYDEAAISMAVNEPVMRLLIAAGEDIAEINRDLKRELLGFGDSVTHAETLNVTESEYQSGCRRRFGKANPEEMKVPFWREMVRAGATGYQAKAQFDDDESLSAATWCFSRFGASFTELPDGRFVQIGGEHEDYYDPDFCIYNDVTVHEQDGTFRILGYPESTFPPTDFHTATYYQGFIYVIGSLGYHGTRQFGTTPVYRFDVRTWKVESVETRGTNPGWISNHKARLDPTGKVLISGGTLAVEVDGQEDHVDNPGQYLLDLGSRIWTRT